MATDNEEATEKPSEDAYRKRVLEFVEKFGVTVPVENVYRCAKDAADIVKRENLTLKGLSPDSVIVDEASDQADIDLLHDILEDLPNYKSLMASDESDNPYGLDLITLHAIRMILQESKDAGYGKSWAQHGEAGVWLNTVRKIDRLKTLALLVLSGSEKVTEDIRVSLVDTLIDLANYVDMWVSYIAKIRPDDFKQWLITRWCRSTGEDEETILETLRNVGTKI